ncbi:IS1 family transposase [Spirosoma utsteinense]|uniref:Transposase n=1 Tax=Spirosoma utsteinense TaxID=2585773 RepID=A0ABR6WF64_9BACT|nr:hypothetical protein [Spirosoma utsteinense]MBC3794577.1 hypothetical protein [Spirosoma utsteinense]
MVTITVSCPSCDNQEAVRRKGVTANGHQPHRRTGYKGEACKRSFQLDYVKRAYLPGIKEQVIDLALNGSGIRDTAASAVRPCVENKHEHRYEYAQKKADQIRSVNPAFESTEATLSIRIEADEQCRAAGRSYVQKKRNPRWL